jgi:hypothetical protein
LWLVLGNDAIFQELRVSAKCAMLRVLLAAATRFLPYLFWRRLLLRSMRAPRECARPDNAYKDLIIRCMERTDRRVPAGRCLERSLTAWLLLHRRVACRLRLGVGWKSHGDPFAHACLEIEGQIVFGEPNSNLVLFETAGSERRPT